MYDSEESAKRRRIVTAGSRSNDDNIDGGNVDNTHKSNYIQFNYRGT